jgi:uncharacterized protein DUF1269
MRMNRRWAPVEVAVFTALLAMVGRPGAAQQPTNAAMQDSTPLTLLLVIFPDTTSAQSAMTNLSSEMGQSQGYQAPQSETGQPADKARPADDAQMAGEVQWVEPYYAIVSKDRSGKVKVSDEGKKGDTPRNARAENSIDGVAALLGNRPSAGGGQAAGAGASQAGVSSADMREMQESLDPGESALIIVVAEPAVDDVTSQMKQAHASEVLDAPLTVAPAQ